MVGNLDLLARHNRWANDRLFADLARLSPDQFLAPLPVNFGSIAGVLNHLLLADRLWLHRFTGEGLAPQRVDGIPYPRLADLRAAREREDERVIAVLTGLAPARLGETLAYVTTDGQPRQAMLAQAVLHFLSHQTHHRGQAHALLALALGTAGGARDLDLIYFVLEETGQG